MNRRMSGVLFLIMGAIFLAGIVSCVSKQTYQERNVASIVDAIRKNNQNYLKIFADQSPARRLTSLEVQELASSSNLKLNSAELIIDNDVAFDSKLHAIESAQSEIRMVYYIYSNDDSSSVITDALIKKAKKGVKVKLLVDFITNYSQMDLFAMMVKEGTYQGRSNIDIRFYNFPSAQILEDAKYMALPCSKELNNDRYNCQSEKQQRMETLKNTESTFFSKMLLAGLYGKNPTALKVAFGMGAEINANNFRSEGDEQPDVARLFDFFKLLVEAKIKKDIAAYIKLQIAMAMYAEDLDPIINQLTGRIPIINTAEETKSSVSHSQEWDHFTDYVHHKLLVVDGKEFQLGGRNIEDSYHMKSRVSNSGKYIFMDTDFHAQTAEGGAADLEKSFDRMFEFKAMVADYERVNRLIPFDFVANSNALAGAAHECGIMLASSKIQKSELEACIQNSMKEDPSFLPETNRIQNSKDKMASSLELYNKNYVGTSKKIPSDNWRLDKKYKNTSDDLTPKDLQTAEVYYIENTSIKQKDGLAERSVGARIGGESKFNKNIHALWYRGLENACKVSRDEKRDIRVIFHTAYLFMPSGLINQLGKMLNGDFGDCYRVRVTFITNSFETTDLNLINIFARYQMIDLFKEYARLKNVEEELFNDSNIANRLKSSRGGDPTRRIFPQLEYFEYKNSGISKGRSLHTKLSLIGDDMIIGSANADTRSYYMDSNNAVFIRNAHDLNQGYIQFVDSIIADTQATKNLTSEFAAYTPESLEKENQFILSAMLARWDKKRRINSDKQIKILRIIDELGKRISHATTRMLKFRLDIEDIKSNEGSGSRNIEVELNDIANEFDDLFKVL